MTITLTEQALSFRFSGARIARRWDGSRAYLHGLARTGTMRPPEGTKATDFCAVLERADRPVLMEVTNYRLAHGGSRTVIGSGALARETADKLRDSVAGIVWASRRGLDAASESPIEEVARRLTNRAGSHPKLLAVLWLEDPRLDVFLARNLEQQIEREIRSHLQAKVVVTNRALQGRVADPFDWLAVS